MLDFARHSAITSAASVSDGVVSYLRTRAGVGCGAGVGVARTGRVGGAVAVGAAAHGPALPACLSLGWVVTVATLGSANDGSATAHHHRWSRGGGMPVGECGHGGLGWRRCRGWGCLAVRRRRYGRGSACVAHPRFGGRAWVADLVDDGLAPETVSACLRLLRNVLDAAVEDDEVPANVAARVRPPRIVKPPLDANDVMTVAEFESVLAQIPSRWRALFALRAYAGARLSEALGIRRADIDLLRRRVHVGHVVLEEVGGVAQLRESGKTRGSDRWLPIPDRVVELLGEHLSTYPPFRDGLVFTGPDGGYVRRDNLRRRVWDPAIASARVDGRTVTRVTMRNLRHKRPRGAGGRS